MRACTNLWMLPALLCMTAGFRAEAAQRWDSLLANSHWYVPQENLLSYMSTSGTNFVTPPPIGLWDQTLWSLGSALDGRFTGSARATFYANPEFSFSSTSSIVGLATVEGQIRMRFTSDSGGSTVIGIGQFRGVDGVTAMQMQMVAGEPGSPISTHWAYMMPYDPDTFTPPDPRPNDDIISTEWAWTLGTTWNLQSEELFGPGGVGNFAITDYRNGYFWGSGSGPAGTPGESFTQLGSITPEGNVLFNALTDSSQTNLFTFTGLVSGDAATGQMVLRTYQFNGEDATFGPDGYAQVVPEPSTSVLIVLSAVAATLAVFLRRRVVSRPTVNLMPGPFPRR
jgi:hypothetical protein